MDKLEYLQPDLISAQDTEKKEPVKTGSELNPPPQKKNKKHFAGPGNERPALKIPRKAKNKGKKRKVPSTLRQGIKETHHPLKGYVKIKE